MTDSPMQQMLRHEGEVVFEIAELDPDRPHEWIETAWLANGRVYSDISVCWGGPWDWIQQAIRASGV